MKNIILHLLFVTFCVFSKSFVVAQSPDAEKKIASMLDNYNFTEAIKQSDFYLAGDSSNIRLLLLKSKALKGLFLYKQAYEVMQKAFRFDSTNILVVAGLSDLCLTKGDNKNAVYFCEKACRLQPDNIYFTLQLSGLYYSNQDLDKCIQILKPICTKDSSNQYALRLLADSYYDLKINDSSEFWYYKMLALSAYDSYAVQKLANIYIRTGDYQKGLQLTEDYLQKDTLLNPVIKLNAWFYHLLKDYKKAVSQFKNCLALGDSSLFVFRKLGLSYYKQELFDSAELYFERAYNLDTNDAETCFYYGVSASRSFLPETGIKYLTKTLDKVLPSEQFLTNIYVELAEAYNNKNQKQDALLVLEKIHAIYPENKRLYFRLAYEWDYYFFNYDKALEYYLLYTKDLPQNTSQFQNGTEITYEQYAQTRIIELNRKKHPQK